MTTVEDLLASVTGEHAEPDPAVDGPVVKGGRYHAIDPVSGQPRTYQRATNFVKLLSDAYRIQQWEKRMVLLGTAMRPDITARAIAAGADDRKTLDALAAEAKEIAGGNKGANLGSALHSLTERLDRGEHVEAPGPLDDDLRAYADELRHHGVRIVNDFIECAVVLPDLGIAGRFDRIVEWDGRLVVADLKTGQYVPEGLEVAVQLALYANASHRWAPGVGWVRMPDVDRGTGLVIHLPAGSGTCSLYAADLVAGWEAVQQADCVRTWRRRSRGLLRALDTAATDDLEALLGASTNEPAGSATREGADGSTGGPSMPPAGPERSLPAPTTNPLVLEVLGGDDPAVVARAAQGLKERLAAALAALGDALPVGVAWPADVPKFREGGPTTWPQVRAVERFVLDLERDARAPFADPLPADPSAPAPAASSPLLDTLPARSVPARTAVEVRDALRARFAAVLPEDIRAAATAEAAAAGVGDVEHLTDAQAAELDQIIAAAERAYEERKGYLASRLQAWGAGPEVERLLALCGGSLALEAWTDHEVHRLDLVLDGIEADVLSLSFTETGEPRFAIHPPAEARLAQRFHGKAALLAAAKSAADRHGRPRPRSAAEAVADPLLVAALVLPTGGRGDGGPNTTKETKEA